VGNRHDDVWEIDCETMEWVQRPRSRRHFLLGAGGSVLGAGLLGSLAACGSDDDDGGGGGGSGKPGSGQTLALSLNGFNTYDQDTAEGVLKAMQGTGYKLIGAEAAFDATKEVDNIRQLVARQPDGLIVLAASAEGAARGAADAKRKGIPVVAQIWFPVSEEIDSAAYDAALQLDTREGGRITVDFIAKDQGVTEGKILEITGLDAQPFSEGYKQGLREALEEYPGLEVAASQQGFYTADGAVKALRPMLSANPDAKIIIDYAAEMGNAIAQELERRGRKDILHVTSDGNDAMIPWLKKDDGAYMKGDRWFSPAEQGIASVNILRAKLEKDEDPTDANVGLEGFTVVSGTSNPVVVKTRQELATAENIDGLPPFGYQQFADQIPFGG
jgi:ABC-type sugar transport system substrate-binding protein